MTAAATIREPCDDDWPQVAELLRVEFQYEFDAGGLPQMTAEELAARHKTGFWSRVVVLGDRVIGYVSLESKRKHKTAAQLVRHPEFKGQGLGERLMRAAEGEGRRRGWLTLYVAVIASRDKLIKLYEGLGYRETGIDAGLQGRDGLPDIPLVIMSRKLC
jgi:ribosomal protein S18 acetylase RimI-like enzyme